MLSSKISTDWMFCRQSAFDLRFAWNALTIYKRGTASKFNGIDSGYTEDGVAKKRRKLEHFMTNPSNPTFSASLVEAIGGDQHRDYHQECIFSESGRTISDRTFVFWNFMMKFESTLKVIIGPLKTFHLPLFVQQFDHYHQGTTAISRCLRW